MAPAQSQSLTTPESAHNSISWPMLLTAQQGLKSTGWGKRDSKGWGNCFSPGWTALGGDCSTQERWLLWHQWMTQYRDPGSFSPTSLLKATNPLFSSGDSSPHPPPSTGAQGEWLQTKFCVLAFASSEFHLSFADRNPTAFYSQVPSQYLLPGSGAPG